MRVDFLHLGDNWLRVYVDGAARYDGHSPIQPNWLRDLILLPAHSVSHWETPFWNDVPNSIDFTDEKLLQLRSIRKVEESRNAN